MYLAQIHERRRGRHYNSKGEQEEKQHHPKEERGLQHQNRGGRERSTIQKDGSTIQGELRCSSCGLVLRLPLSSLKMVLRSRLLFVWCRRFPPLSGWCSFIPFSFWRVLRTVAASSNSLRARAVARRSEPCVCCRCTMRHNQRSSVHVTTMRIFRMARETSSQRDSVNSVCRLLRSGIYQDTREHTSLSIRACNT